MDLSKNQIPNFDPRSRAYRRKLWVRVAASGGVSRLVIFWWRIAAVLALLALCGWLSLAAGVYGFMRVKHDFTDASYLNLVFPHRWPLHRAALGRHYLERGQRAFADKQYNEAAQFYAAGVSRVPDDIAARRQLAIIYIRFGLVDAGLNILESGLPLARGDLDYLKLLFGLLNEIRNDTKIIDLARTYLPTQVDDVLPHQFLALQAAQAHYHRGNYDEAEKIAADWRLSRSLEGQLLLARCDWERGYPDLAILRLEQQRETFPNRDELSLQLIRFYRDLSRQEDALNEALLRHVADPASPGARVDLIYSWHHKSDTTRYTRELESYLKDYATDARALMLLAWFAADTGELELARRLRAIAETQAFPVNAFELVIVQAHIFRGDYRPALEAAEASLQGPAGKDPRYIAVLSGLRALAAFGAGDPANGEVYLQSFLIREYLRASDALLLAERLTEIGARNQARNVLTTAVANDAANQAALTALIKLETTDGNLAALETHLPRLLAMRKPARTVLQEAYLKLDEATPTRAALRQAVKAAIEKSPTSVAPGA